MPFFTRPQPTLDISISEVLVTVYNYHVTASHGQALALRSDVQSGLCYQAFILSSWHTRFYILSIVK